MSVQNIHSLRPPSPLKKCTHQHFSNGKFAMNLIKYGLKCTESTYFSIDHLPLKEYVLYSFMDGPLSRMHFQLPYLQKNGQCHFFTDKGILKHEGSAREMKHQMAPQSIMYHKPGQE